MCAAVLAPISTDPLLRLARHPQDLESLAFAAAIELGRSGSRINGCLTLGLPREEFAKLLDCYFPGAKVSYLPGSTRECGQGNAEFNDLVDLLMEHARDGQTATRWLAHAIAIGCMAYDHLWQDLGMPDRGALRSLLTAHFPTLVARNTRDMRWKKFFYKQLCDRGGLNLCRAPSCDVCSELKHCFGPEDDD